MKYRAKWVGSESGQIREEINLQPQVVVFGFDLLGAAMVAANRLAPELGDARLAWQEHGYVKVQMDNGCVLVLAIREDWS